MSQCGYEPTSLADDQVLYLSGYGDTVITQVKREYFFWATERLPAMSNNTEIMIVLDESVHIQKYSYVWIPKPFLYQTEENSGLTGDSRRHIAICPQALPIV